MVIFTEVVVITWGTIECLQLWQDLKLHMSFLWMSTRKLTAGTPVSWILYCWKYRANLAGFRHSHQRLRSQWALTNCVLTSIIDQVILFSDVPIFLSYRRRILTSAAFSAATGAEIPKVSIAIIGMMVTVMRTSEIDRLTTRGVSAPRRISALLNTDTKRTMLKCKTEKNVMADIRSETSTTIAVIYTPADGKSDSVTFEDMTFANDNSVFFYCLFYVLTRDASCWLYSVQDVSIHKMTSKPHETPTDHFMDLSAWLPTCTITVCCTNMSNAVNCFMFVHLLAALIQSASLVSIQMKNRR